MKDRLKLISTILAALFICTFAVAQSSTQPQNTIYCTYQDGSEVSFRYIPVDATKKNEPPAGKPWMPGGAPILLFTTVDLVIGTTTVPPGAYTVFPIRNRSDWTLVVNRNVTTGAAYDSQQDVTRVNMETSKLSSAGRPLSLSLGHTQPKVCSLQLVYADTGAWTDVKQK